MCNCKQYTMTFSAQLSATMRSSYYLLKHFCYEKSIIWFIFNVDPHTSLSAIQILESLPWTYNNAFILTLVSEFMSLSTTYMYLRLHVKRSLFLSDFDQLWIFLEKLWWKSPHTKFRGNPSILEPSWSWRFLRFMRTRLIRSCGKNS
jgi:hypothetical protein